MYMQSSHGISRYTPSELRALKYADSAMRGNTRANDYLPSPHFAQRLMGLRNKRGISKSALAGAVGVKPPCVCMWESGRHAPTGLSLARMLDFFGEEGQCLIL